MMTFGPGSDYSERSPIPEKCVIDNLNYSALLPVSEDSTILKPGPIVELKAIPRTYLPFDVKGFERKILLYNARILSAN
jgi:hypothetical protein